MSKKLYPLTNPQKSIWQTEQFYKGSSIENIAGTATILEKVDFNKFEKAINLFIKKNDSFRLKFILDNDQVKQYVEDFSPVHFKRIKVSSEKDVKKIENELSNAPFETLNSFLFKFILFEFPDGHGGFVTSIHHLISDAWTSGIVISQIIDMYDKLLNNEEISSEKEPSYIDYINSENEYKKSEKFIKDKIFWNSLFANIPEIATIPSLTNTTSASSSAKRKQFIINKNLMNLISKFCKDNKISEFNFFMAILAIYIGKISSLDEFVIGTPILNRSNFKEKHTAGMFISVIPFKVSLDNISTFVEFCTNIAKDFFNIFRHQKYSYQTLLEDLRKQNNSSIPNLFNILFSYQNMRSNKQTAKTNYESKWLFNNNISDDLDVHLYDINDTGEIIMAYDYKSEKYSIDDIYSIHERLLNIINQVLENNTIILEELEIVTQEEKKKILFDFNNTFAEFQKSKTISMLFEEQAAKTPDNIALVFEEKSLTYRELNEKANSLAFVLRENGIKNNDIIGIMVNRSLEMIVAILAVLKSGACYIPIDPEYPESRITYMLKDSMAKMLLTFKNLQNKVDFDNKLFIELNEKFYNRRKHNLENINDSQDLAYIIYTSGSTGKPKGVMLKHESLSNLINYCNNYVEYLKNNKYICVASVTTVSFDIFIFETLISLQKGLKLVIANEKEQTIPRLLNDLIKKHNVQAIQMTPSRMQLLVNNIKDIPCLNNLKFITLAGEQLPISLVNELKKICNPIIYNGYGPSETTVFSTLTDVTNYKTMTIGKPLDNTQIYILSSNLGICPINTPGEIYISGAGVGLGYLNNKELTIKNYLPNKFNTNSLLYKTGDIGYYLENGEIICLGRSDNQVKIRGLRIELEEIEREILKEKNINNCIVVKLVSSDNHEFLCAYYTASSTVTINPIRLRLQKTLPNYMVPQYFMQLEKFPYTPNGKIDRKNLPLPNLEKLDKSNIEPRNNIDVCLINILSELLNIDNISIDDSFFELGGDSLSAINLCTKVYSEFNVQLYVKDILENSTIQDLSNLIASKNSNFIEENIIPKAKKKSFYPASSAQTRTFYASSMSGENSLLYNIAGGLILDKMPDVKKLELAFNKLVKRQASLRTYFEIENEKVVQKIIDSIDFKLDCDLTPLKEDTIDDAFNKFNTPFNLSKAPLLKVKLLRLENNKAFLMVSMHHIISDGTSLSILLDELCKLYNNEEPEKLKIDYKDYAVWENENLNSNLLKEAESFWINKFNSEIPVLNMPTKPRPAVQSFEGSKIYSKIDSVTLNKINEISKNFGVTPYMVLLSAYYILLNKYTSQKDIIVGSPIVNRNISELYNIIGMFINTLPLKAHIDENSSFKDFLISIKNMCLESYKYQNYPFDELVNSLHIQRDTSRNPLFDTMFIYQNNGYLPASFEGINAKYYLPDTKISKFDLSLEVVPNEDLLNLTFEYSTKLFNKSFIENLSNHYLNILHNVLDNLDTKLSNICMLSEKEKNKILYEFNDTKMNYPKDKTISMLFEEQVLKTPNSIAIVFENKKLTYKELNEKANSVAYFLRDFGIKKNDLVGIMMNRSLEMIIAILAVLKSGGAYIPIDPEYPEDRTTYMLENSNAKLLLTLKNLENNISFTKKQSIDLSNSEIYNNPTTNLNCINEPNSLAYVIYTSGSTGLPKGVCLKQVNIVNFIYATVKALNLNSSNTVISITTISFDIFVLESLLPLLTGMKIILASEKAQTDAKIFNDLCITNNVDIIQTTPSRMQAFLFDKNIAQFIKKVKYLLIGGEPFSPELLQKLHSIYAGKIYNMYGPTETAVWSSIQDLSNTENITIGNPIGNTQMYVLDNFKNLLPVGVPGELYIAGDGVCDGYLNNKDLTNKVFINNPFIKNSIMYKTGDFCVTLPNGEFKYLERIDNQVKIRGLRIELGEIESKICTYPNIQKACVIKQTLNNRDFISAYFISSKRINISQLRKYLSSYLPKYMIPAYFTSLDSFPQTPNGKINKKALPLPKEILSSSSKSEYIAPKTTLEKQFVAIWEQILNIKPIGLTDNFFELGGDSILAMNLNIELKSITDSINYSDIFKFPTIAELIKKCNAEDETYEFMYIEKNYDKYSNLLENNNKIPSIFNLKYIPSGNILLTGATGFLGMHILDSLVKHEKGKIYCIVREEPSITAQTKLYQKLNYYFGNKYDKLIGKRIFAINGDVCKIGFGLSQEDLLNVTNNVNIVVNAAARVSHYGNYSDFYKTNVKSVQNIIEFCRSFDKKLYHISTLSVSGNAFDTSSIKQTINKTTYFTESNLYVGQSLENVYVRSKFEAECLVLDSILDGLDAYILRVGNLMPRLRDGLFQENLTENAFINRISAFIKIGAIPDYIENEYLEFTPVDIAANSIIKILTHPIKNNRIFHLFNHNHIYINKCLKYFKVLNPNLQVLTEPEFKKTIKSLITNKKKKEILGSVINDLDKDLHLMYKTDIIIKSNNTIKYLSKIGFIWPKISNKYMTKFLNVLRRIL